jgi:hypothetical protein
MGSEPSESPNWRSIIHLANCPSRNSPTDSSDESKNERHHKNCYAAKSSSFTSQMWFVIPAAIAGVMRKD